LPIGRNSPQKPAYGLYVEKFSGTAFTAPRAKNFRSWFYRIRPSVVHGEFRSVDTGLIRTAPDIEAVISPNQLRWDPLPMPDKPCDFIDGLVTVATNGDARAQLGIGIHVYRANRSMRDRFSTTATASCAGAGAGPAYTAHRVWCSASRPGDIAIVPRGMKFRVGSRTVAHAVTSVRTMERNSNCRSAARSQRWPGKQPRLCIAGRGLRDRRAISSW
jgi:homogentisate 1,2-dioxygenase